MNLCLNVVVITYRRIKLDTFGYKKWQSFKVEKKDKFVELFLCTYKLKLQPKYTRLSLKTYHKSKYIPATVESITKKSFHFTINCKKCCHKSAKMQLIFKCKLHPFYN